MDAPAGLQVEDHPEIAGDRHLAVVDHGQAHGGHAVVLHALAEGPGGIVDEGDGGTQAVLHGLHAGEGGLLRRRDGGGHSEQGGGGEVDSNPRLRLAVDKAKGRDIAKAIDVPKREVDQAIISNSAKGPSSINGANSRSRNSWVNSFLIRFSSRW